MVIASLNQSLKVLWTEATILQESGAPCFLAEIAGWITTKLPFEHAPGQLMPIYFGLRKNLLNDYVVHRSLTHIQPDTQWTMPATDPLAQETFCESFIALQTIRYQSLQLFFHLAAVREASAQFASQFPEGMLSAGQQIHRCQANSGRFYVALALFR